MAVCAQALSIDPGMRHGVDGLLEAQTKHFADYGGGGDFDENNVIKTDAVERVFESEAALNFVSHDHASQDVFDSQR